MLSKITGLSRVDKLYRNEMAGLSEREFIQKAIEVLGLQFHLSHEELANIPKEGPVIVIANHPFGVQDAILLAWVLGSVRKDYKILANNFFSHIDEMKEKMITINAFRTTQGNSRGLKEAIKHLKSDGILGIFPAGSVSRFQWKKYAVTDDVWPETIARLVKMTSAEVVPVHFSGRNSTKFHLLGSIHPLLRTALLPKEVLKKKKPIQIQIGHPVKYSYLSRMDNRAIIDYLRMRCFLLKEVRHPKDKKTQNTIGQPIITPIPKEELTRDIEQLPKKNFLFSKGDFEVYFAQSDEIPSLLKEIGRLREITFREVGEGTGKPLDLDAYDETYLHLFVWNNKEKEVLGSYRMGQVDKILEKRGKAGLYTSEFYQYTEAFLDKHRMALEMGRSFVQKKYQKKPNSLVLLWKGICAYIARNPQYRYLFGAVSISNEYDSRSCALIASLLLEPRKSIKSKMPAKIKVNKEVRTFCKEYRTANFEDLSLLVKNIEDDAKDIPVLLKQYLKLGGQVYSFCIDKAFNNTLDGLIVVDLPNAPLKRLNMFMGENTENYLEHHKRSSFVKVK